MIRIFLVDDHPIVREGLTAVLEDQPDFQVVGAAGSAAEALSRAQRLRPDVMLLDLELPDGDGVEAIAPLLHAIPPLGILVFTAYDADERVFGAIRSGARGYLLKGAAAEEIARAVRVLHGGGSYLEPRIAAKVLRQIGGLHPVRGALSGREREVLRLVADGLSNKQISHSLGIAERTVKFHVSSILNKLDVGSRAGAVAAAVRRGLL